MSCFLADVASYKRHNEVEETPEHDEPPKPTPATAPRIRRITKTKEETVEQALIVGKKTVMTLAGLDIVNLVSKHIQMARAVRSCR